MGKIHLKTVRTGLPLFAATCTSFTLKSILLSGQTFPVFFNFSLGHFLMKNVMPKWFSNEMSDYFEPDAFLYVGNPFQWFI